MAAFDFRTFVGEELSTDVVMPSSPPMWFGGYEQSVGGEGSLWQDYMVDGGGVGDGSEGGGVQEGGTEGVGMVVDEGGRAGVEF